jgi:hypothetical protein
VVYFGRLSYLFSSKAIVKCIPSKGLFPQIASFHPLEKPFISSVPLAKRSEGEKTGYHDFPRILPCNSQSPWVVASCPMKAGEALLCPVSNYDSEITGIDSLITA